MNKRSTEGEAEECLKQGLSEQPTCRSSAGAASRGGVAEFSAFPDFAEFSELPHRPSSSPDFSAPLPLQPRLRVGVFATTRLQPRPIVEAFARIAQSNFAEIVLLAADEQAEPVEPWLWQLYCRIDRWAFSTRAELSESIDLIAHFGSSVPLEHLEPIRILNIPAAIAEHPALNTWQAKVASIGLDVAFSLGHLDPKLIDGIARYGVWRFVFGGGPHRESRSAGIPGIPGMEGFHEVAEGHGITTSSLTARLADDSEKLLYASHSLTSPISITRNREIVLRRAAKFPGRVLKEVHRTAGATLAASQLPGQSASLRANDALSLPDFQLTRSLATLGQRVLRRGLQKLFYADRWFIEQWFLAYRFSIDHSDLPTLGNLTCLIPPKDRLWADPFPLQRDGRYYIFFEELIFSEGWAHISVIELERNGHCSKVQRVLDRPYHLSYPFLIEEDGQLFMVPESGQNGSVELYRCVNFPDRWELEKVLLRASCCADATFHRADGQWWMFVSIGADDIEAHDELHLYYADHLCGEWQAHCLNPIKSDVGGARSAGRLYEHEGKLYRPAQIGVPAYGSGMSIHQILKLTPEEYVEQEVGRILTPSNGEFIGVHTVNRAGALSVVDGLLKRRRLGEDRHDTFEPEYWATGAYSSPV